jgi:hypothetical protein
MRERDEFDPWTSEELEAMPTLSVGQSDDLKVETDDARWWLSRCGAEDGEMFRVHLERRTSDGWRVTGEYEPF